MLILFSTIVTANIYTKDHNQCTTSYQSQDCTGTEHACGYTGGILYCDEPSTINSSIPSTNANVTTTNYNSSLNGGYVLNCVKADSTCTPWLCQRNSTCYDVNRITTCLADTVYSRCDSCISGYTYCDAGYTDANGCEIDIGTTNCQDGANNNINSSCECACDTNYLDCDGGGINATNGCEVQDGGSCTVGTLTGTYDGCTCVVETQNFQTGSQANYSTNLVPLLWGYDFGTGFLLNLTNNASGRSFYVDSNSNVFTNGNLSKVTNIDASGDITATGNITSSALITTESLTVTNDFIVNEGDGYFYDGNLDVINNYNGGTDVTSKNNHSGSSASAGFTAIRESVAGRFAIYSNDSVFTDWSNRAILTSNAFAKGLSIIPLNTTHGDIKFITNGFLDSQIRMLIDRFGNTHINGTLAVKGAITLNETQVCTAENGFCNQTITNTSQEIWDNVIDNNSFFTQDQLQNGTWLRTGEGGADTYIPPEILNNKGYFDNQSGFNSSLAFFTDKKMPISLPKEDRLHLFHFDTGHDGVDGENYTSISDVELITDDPYGECKWGTGCLNFTDTASAYIKYDTNFNTNDSGTLSLWLKPKSFNAGKLIVYSGSYWPYFYDDKGNGAGDIGIYWAGWTGLMNNKYCFSDGLNEWHNIVLTWNVSNTANARTFLAFCNGKEVAKRTTAWTTGQQDIDLRLGSSGATFDGYYDEVAFWNNTFLETEDALDEFNAERPHPDFGHSGNYMKLDGEDASYWGDVIFPEGDAIKDKFEFNSPTDHNTAQWYSIATGNDGDGDFSKYNHGLFEIRYQSTTHQGQGSVLFIANSQWGSQATVNVLQSTQANQAGARDPHVKYITLEEGAWASNDQPELHIYMDNDGFDIEVYYLGGYGWKLNDKLENSTFDLATNLTVPTEDNYWAFKPTGSNQGMFLDTGGDFNIGHNGLTYSATYDLQVTRGASWTGIDAGSGSWSSSSTKEVKQDIVNINTTTEYGKFKNLDFVTYKWNETVFKESDVDYNSTQYGLVAEHTQPLYPDMENYTIDWHEIAISAYSTIQTLQEKIELLELRVNTLEKTK